MSDELKLRFGAADRNGRRAFTLTMPGGEVEAGRVDPADSVDREAVVARLCVRLPGLGLPERRAWLCSQFAAAAIDDEGDCERKGSVAAQLVQLAHDSGWQLFKSADGEAFAQVPAGDRCETLPLARSAASKRRLASLWRRRTGGVASTHALAAALAALEGEALDSGKTQPVALRLAEHEGAIYFDLADERWRVVRIDPEGWRVIEAAESPVRFVRRAGTRALPEPVAGGTLDELRSVLSPMSDDEWTLTRGFLVAALNPIGGALVLAVTGEAGSAKSTTAALIVATLDPAAPLLRRPPRDERELMIAARTRRVVGLDNLSGLSPWLSDSFAALATGTGSVARALYSDDDEVTVNGSRPIILNGIESMAERSDLADRAVSLRLRRIPGERFKRESVLWKSHAEMLPRVLGALFDAVSCALRRRDSIEPSALSRMADAAHFVESAAPALGLAPGDFYAAVQRNAADLHEDALEADPFGSALRAYLRDSGGWEGTAGGLLAMLNGKRSEHECLPHGWPRSAKAAAGHLRRLAPSLRGTGWTVEEPVGRTGNKKRAEWRIARIAAADLEPCPDELNRGASADCAAHRNGSAAADAPHAAETPCAPVRFESLPCAGGMPDAALAVDAAHCPRSSSEREPEPDELEAIDERAAILECDGGLGRSEAESQA